MERKIYIKDEEIMLVEYKEELDAEGDYNCWQDPDTQAGYNHYMNESLEEYKNKPIRSRFIAAIMRNEDQKVIGSIFLSPENCLPDLAIMLYKTYRYRGYGTKAFRLALKYCFETFQLEKIYAGCYEHNKISLKMLEKCGFVPHPEGNIQEKHFLDGTPIMQYDYVKFR